MSEKGKETIKKLTENLPHMSERERGYLEGTVATAAAMSRRNTEEKGQEKSTI